MTDARRAALQTNLTLAAATALIVALAVMLEAPVADAVFGQDRVLLSGPDDYMRVYRAREILDGDALLIRHTEEINAPIGVTLHWTAPMDYLLASVGILLRPVINASSQLDVAWAWLPVCLGAAYVVVMIGMMRRGFGWQAAIMAGLLVALSPCFHRVFRLGHPDHHCLVELLLLVALAGWIPRAGKDGLAGQPTRTGAIVSGLAMGLAIWVASQALLFWAALAIGLSYACLVGSPEAGRRYARVRFAWNCATGLVVLAGFLVDNWPAQYVVAVDKISLAHVALMAVAFLAPGRADVGRSEEGTLTGENAPAKSEVTARGQAHTNRTIAFLATLAAFLVWIVIDRGRAFEHVAGETFFRWSEHIAELQPLYSTTLTDWSVKPMHAWLGFMPYALPLLWVFFVLSKSVPRPVKCALGLAAPIVLVLAILQRRWMDHVNVAVTPVVVLGGLELCRTLLARHTRRQAVRCFLAAAVLLGVLAYPSARAILSRTAEGERFAVAYQRRTDFVAQQINAYEARLRDAAGYPTSSRRGGRTTRSDEARTRTAILCEDGEGPSLLYWTGLPVVAAPYHRALEGILEVSRFFAERDPLAAREQLDRLGVRYIVMPPRAHEQLMQFERMAFGEPRSFDPSDESLDRFGRVLLHLNYRPGYARTMAYRLVMESGTAVIPGVERIAEINEGAKTPDGDPMPTGLLYVVHDFAPPAQEPPGLAGG
ncbi:MAG: hypothetical protein ABII12_04975 [Planctomycetota bacterium]